MGAVRTSSQKPYVHQARNPVSRVNKDVFIDKPNCSVTLISALGISCYVNAKLFLLSTYMGHIHPEDTYWYLSSTPELMDIASRKYEDIYGGDAHE